MDGFLQLFVFGSLSVLFLVISLNFKEEERYCLGLVFSIAGNIILAWPAYMWMSTLRSSGKSDWFLCGALSYPILGWLPLAVIVTGVVCLIKNIQGLIAQEIPAPLR